MTRAAPSRPPAPWPTSARQPPAAPRPCGRRSAAPTDHDTTPEVDTDLAIALALWRITGEGGRSVPALASVFGTSIGRQWLHRTAARAARVTAVLGPAGRPLTTRLQALLDNPAQAPSAILGLLAVADPAGLDRARLAEASLHSGETRTDLKGACDAYGRSAPPPSRQSNTTG